MEITKHDWKLFREKLPGWQEAYMERLNREYVVLLSGEGNGSEKFWKLCERIQEDKRSPGVLLRLQKGHMLYDIVALVNDGVISPDDLDGFSDDLREAVQYVCSR